jgi:hypothetical protein
MSALGLMTFSGVTVGFGGSLVGIPLVTGIERRSAAVGDPGAGAAG